MLEEPPSLVRKVKATVESEIETNIATLQMSKPIMSKELEAQVHAAVVQYKEKAKWAQWGLAHYRDQGACILLHGDPGTGKTIIARYLAKRIEFGMREMDISTFGSNQPGTNERNIDEFFAECTRDRKAIFLDECDSILWNRAKAGADSMWMVSVINKILKAIAMFKYPLFLATNRVEELDPALDRRIIAKVHVKRPEYDERLRLWAQKIPKKFPFQPTAIQQQELASFALTGAEIENIVIRVASVAINSKRMPKFEDFCNVAKEESEKHIAK